MGAGAGRRLERGETILVSIAGILSVVALAGLLSVVAVVGGVVVLAVLLSGIRPTTWVHVTRSR